MIFTAQDPTSSRSPMELARFHMIEQQIRPWNVLDGRMLQLLSDVKREDFVPAAYKNLAFADVEIPLGATSLMLAPKVQARWVQDMQLTGVESVLHIGAGSGYKTALLARLSKHVTALEIDAVLAEQAAANLRQAVVANADVKVQDGAKWAQISGEYDAIVLSGSLAQVPQELLAKLKIGGRLSAIVGHEPVMRFTVVTRTQAGFATTQPWDTTAPRLLGFAEPSRFSF